MRTSSKDFGEEIAGLVDGVTKLSQLELVSERTKQAENFRKLMLAMSNDIRVLLVKLADRLHNMRTLDYIASPEKRRRIAQETVDIYAPLAGRIGMQNMREELEDLAFAELNPEARNSIVTRLARLEDTSGDRIGRIADQIKRKLAENGIDAWVYGRAKRPWSIWRKLKEKQLNFEQLSDILGFRVIVQRPDDCYRALGVLHRNWRMIPDRFKDFISNPKTNGYRSIHTTVMGPENQRVEVQIRTEEMHEIAERGVAAHWRYREHVANAEPSDSALEWLRDMVDLLERGDSAEEFLDHSKLSLYQDQVFCFTPKGDLIALPRGATPIDFAYAVHTDLGNTTVGAKVNGVHVPLHTPLRNGDQVEIIRTKDQTPVAAVGAVRRHRPCARGNPPLPAPCPARRACRLRPQDRRKGLRRSRLRVHRQGDRGGGQEAAAGQGRGCLRRCRTRRAAGAGGASRRSSRRSSAIPTGRS